MTEIMRKERFICEPALKMQAHERVTQVQMENLVHRLERLEQVMERLERRLWLTVYGVVAVILAQGIEQFLHIAP